MTVDSIRAALSAYCEHAPQHAETVGRKATIVAVKAGLRDIASDGWLSPHGQAEAVPLIGKPKGELRQRDTESLFKGAIR